MRKKNSSPRKPNRDLGGLTISSFSVPQNDHQKIKDSIISAATSGLSKFPERLEVISDIFKKKNPALVLSCFCFYGLQSFVGKEGVSKKSILNSIQQHHAELLQALMLTIPQDEWGVDPITPKDMQIVFDTVVQISETFLYQRALGAKKAKDDQEKTLLLLQDRLRFHTQGVRNWGYYGDVVNITKDLYAPLDNGFINCHGFSASNLLKILDRLMREYERRATARFIILQKIARGKNYRQIIRLYYKHVPDLQGDPEDIIAQLPSTTLKEHAMSFVMAHYDLRIPDISTFSVDDIASISDLPNVVVEKALTAISKTPGSLQDQKIEHLFLSNPIWSRPFIKTPFGFFIPIPQAAFSHINTIMHRLAEEAGLKNDLERIRANYLENKMLDVLNNVFTGASVTPSVKWILNDQVFETDVLVLLDRTVLIFEAKSHRLTPEGLRGAPDRVKRHIQDLVLDPSIQSLRLEELIIAAQSDDDIASDTIRKLGIDPNEVDRIIRVSLTLEDFSVVSSLEGNLKEVGWIPADHNLAPTISIADFISVVDILDDPLIIAHYLAERNHLQKSFEIFGDELDFLGLYLTTGFNLGAMESHKGPISATGMSKDIDSYYESRDAGVRIRKPLLKIRPLFKDITTRLSTRKPAGWTTIGISLLSCADYNEQKSIENKLNELKILVRNNHRDPKHLNTLSIHPPQDRKSLILFYLYPASLRENRKRSMEILANEAFSETSCNSCIIFGRCIDNWITPYEIVGLATRPR